MDVDPLFYHSSRHNYFAKKKNPSYINFQFVRSPYSASVVATPLQCLINELLVSALIMTKSIKCTVLSIYFTPQVDLKGNINNINNNMFVHDF